MGEVNDISEWGWMETGREEGLLSRERVMGVRTVSREVRERYQVHREERKEYIATK